ncbi:catalase family protein [Agrobacterium sp. AGB01]|uniref:catalase family protein n=1 Tax=Agrobacterium sp. AGB01 TaxID=2769302 RepID=UPI001781DD7B|nr:catalase family protein [Agrobacterium sp. AGB01]MBD9389242.1 catalase family protein [Agrobacterium sp. AGB01]
MTLSPPVPFSPELETFRANETETIDGLKDAFDAIMDKTANDYGHAVRSVHAKSHGILSAKMTVHSDLSNELAQGLFSQPGTYGVHMRLSTNAGDILPDTIALPRGLAMKVVGVRGKRLPDADGTSQDFVMVNGPVFQAANAEKFLGNLKLLVKTTDRLEGTKEVLSSVLQTVNKGMEAIGISSPAIQSLGGAPNVDPLGETYFSVTPFRYGDFVAKFRLKPISAGLVELSGREVDTSTGDDAIRNTVQAEMLSIRAEWEFQVQLCRDVSKQPIEDPTVEWSESDTPFVTVATVAADPQDTWRAESVQEVDEMMRFSVWTGLAAHQPLGNINRARKATYQRSAEFRQSFNRCPIREPD